MIKITNQKRKINSTLMAVLLMSSVFITLFSFPSIVAAEPTPLALKWTGVVAGGGESLLIADIRPEIPGEEVVHAGGGVQPSSTPGRVTVLNGLNGSVIQTVSIEGLGDTAQAQMADVDNDGLLEIIVPLQQPAGLYILNSEDLSVLWNAPGSYSGDVGYFTSPSGGRVDASPVIGDIDGDNYKDIFVGVMAYEEEPQTGSIRHLEYDPTANGGSGGIVQRNIRIVWHPCAGGMSLGDTDNDGTYELYMSDRSQGGMSDGGWGRGLRSFWAENLTSRWDVYDWMMSSNIPMLIDVNGDGIRDVVATDLSRGVMVLNSSNGHPLVNDESVVLRESIPSRRNHYQSSIYDIDGDGNPEILSGDGFEAGYDNVTVWDLWDWTLDATINTTIVGDVPTRSWKGPTAGEVTGDGILDLIVVTFDPETTDNGQVQIYDHNFELVHFNTGLRHRAIDAVVQDVDQNDGGLNELLVLTQGGIIYCFETQGIAASPRARTEVQFYSESRLGASEYVAYEPPSTDASYPSAPSTPNTAPTQTTPIIAGSTKADDLICYNQSTSDADGDSVTNIYSWTKNGVPFANLILPFDSMTDVEDEYSGYAYSNDYSGYDNIANVFGASWTSAGVKGGAYSFDGTDLMRVEEQGNSLGGDGSWEEITVEFWIKATEYTGFERVLWKHNRYDAGLTGYRVDFSATETYNAIRWYVYTENVISPETPIQNDIIVEINYGLSDWHHIVCTYTSGDGLKVYVDGLESTSLPGVSGNIQETNGNPAVYNLGDYLGDWGYTFTNGIMDANKGPLDITRGRPGGDFIGMLDELKIYPSELSSEQIYQNYIEASAGLSSQATIVSEETEEDEEWACLVTPNDGLTDGTTLSTESVVIEFANTLPELFTDGFESGTFGKWNGTVVEGAGASASVTTTRVYAGTYSGQFTVPISAGARAYSYVNFGGLPEVYAEAYVYIPSGLSLANGQKMFFIQLRDQSNNALGSYGLIADGTGMKWAVQFGNTPSDLSTTVVSSGWHHLSIYFVQAATGRTLFLLVDGEEVASLNYDTSSTNPITQARFGATYYTGSFLTTTYMDNVVIYAEDNPTDDEAILVVRGSDNSVYTNTFETLSKTWLGWNALPSGSTPDSPAAVVVDDDLYTVVCGSDGSSLWLSSVNLSDDSFSGWSAIPDGVAKSSPTLATNGTDLFLVVRGMDNSIYLRIYDIAGATWGSWISLGGATSDTIGAAVLDNELHMVVRSYDLTGVWGNETLWHGILSLETLTFSDWINIPGSTPSAPVLTVSQIAGSLCLGVRGSDDIIYINEWDGVWEGWTAIENGATNDTPALTITQNDLQIVVRGSDGASLWHCTMNLNTQSQTEWASVQGSSPTKPILTN